MNVAQLRVSDENDTILRHDADIAAIGERASRLGVEIADVVGLIDDLGKLGHRQMETLKSVVREARDTGAANARLAASMEETRASAAETRAVLSASADTVARTLDGAVNDLRSLSEGVIGFGASLEKVAGTIKLVREASASINEIARETQLVALNASIEAARAGDAGKGFAVVASEVKNLAGQTAKATEEIAAQIGNIQSVTRVSVDAVQEISRTIEEMSSITGTIATAIEEQSAATQEISNNIQQTAEAVREVSKRIVDVSDEATRTGQNASTVRETSTEVATAISDLRELLVRVVRNSMEEVSRSDAARRTVGAARS